MKPNSCSHKGNPEKEERQKMLTKKSSGDSPSSDKRTGNLEFTLTGRTKGWSLPDSRMRHRRDQPLGLGALGEEAPAAWESITMDMTIVKQTPYTHIMGEIITQNARPEPICVEIVKRAGRYPKIRRTMIRDIMNIAYPFELPVPAAAPMAVPV